MSKETYRGKLYYSLLSPLYERVGNATGYFEGVQQIIHHQEIASGSRILDVGCGHGAVAFAAAEKCPDAEVVAFDISRRMIDYARWAQQSNGHRSIEFCLGDIENAKELNGKDRAVTLQHEQFDQIIAAGCFEYVDLEPSVAEIAKYLKHGGTFMNIAVRNNLVGRLRGLFAGFNLYTKKELIAAFEKCGFANVHEITGLEKRAARLMIPIIGSKTTT